MSAAAASTSLERTYRYLRIGVAGTVVVIFVAMAVAAASVGWLTSVSDYYYTSARDALVGALIAVAFGLVALSGRGVDRALLDAAALFVPLIALVPTTVARGSIPGVDVPCAQRCFPPDHEADAAAGVITYLVVVGLVVLVALLLAALRQVSLAQIWGTVVLAVGVLAVVGLTWAFAREAFLQHGHFVATIAFFALFAAVAVRSAFSGGSEGARPRAVFRMLYAVVAAGLALVLVAYVVLLPGAEAGELPIVLLAEGAALALFFVFWVVQGIEKWNEGDPTLVGR